MKYFGLKFWLFDKLQNFKSDLKRWHTSWTIWINGVTGSLITAFLSFPADAVIAFMPQLEPYVSSELFRTAMAILLAYNFINTALRFKTTKALRNK